MTTASPCMDSERRHRRLLRAARCRFAEDRLADAVSAGIRQAVLFGTALDTFAAHNPYRGLRVFRFEHRFECGVPESEFDRTTPAFMIGLGPSRPVIPHLDARALAIGTEFVFDYPHDMISPPDLAERLARTGWDVLADLDSAALTIRYLDVPTRWQQPAHHDPERDRTLESPHDSGVRVVHARLDPS
ncbi:class I SAM-dependent methyltransferase [Nocardia jejuensis]|uniref:class I SAM-dependent methyltransferase n=1 Tax=Nocardia jejuensis TaxID=328049 RepID=UPI000832D562|nr:class I SAM-dependent methyltransferase [Nocardia jejuensis]